MAEKEERIYLFTDKIICENCKDWYEHIDSLDSQDCMECAPADFPYITRTEAINRMAKALAFAQAKTFVNKDQWEIVMRGCRYEAEAALEALLNGK